MRRTYFVTAAALALTLLPGVLAGHSAPGGVEKLSVSPAPPLPATIQDPGSIAGSPSDPGEAGDDDESSMLLPRSSGGRVPDRHGVGALHLDALSILDRDVVSTPLCRGRPLRREPRATSPSRAACAFDRLVFHRPARLYPSDPEPRRFPPHPRP
jgi:hypothetical protein